jgi:hypothetical protein
MIWMNRSAVEMSAENCADHPVLGPATRFLKILMDYIDDNTDGWAHCPTITKSAGKLMELIDQNTGGFHHPSSGSSITLKDVEKAIVPIRRMATFQKEKQKQYGNKFEFDAQEAWSRAKRD